MSCDVEVFCSLLLLVCPFMIARTIITIISRTTKRIETNQVVTLTDCMATTSEAGQTAAAGKDGTFGMFSSPMTAADFKQKLVAA